MKIENINIPLMISGNLIENINLNDNYYRMRIETPQIARKAKPGHFVMLSMWKNKDPFLKRPFSFYGIESDSGTFDILYKEIKLLEEAGYNLELTGFSETEIQTILANNQMDKLPDTEFVGDFQDLNEVLIISIDDSNQRETIKGFFELPITKKSMRGKEALEVIKRKCSNS